MVSTPSLPSIAAELASPLRNHEALVRVNDHIRTSDAEQLQARNVEEVLKPESDIDRDSRAKLEVIFLSRATVSRTEVRVEGMSDITNQVRAVAAFQLSLTNAAPQLRDSGADNNIVSLDVSA